MSNPIEKYLEKKAGIGALLSKAKEPAFNAAVGAGAIGAVSAGTAAVSFGAKKLYDAVTKHRDFRAMLSANEDLHEALERDPKFFNQVYSSLRSVNPQFAAEPMIAGHYMRQMTESPLTAGGKIESAMLYRGQQHGSSPVLDAAMEGALSGAKSGINKPPNPHAELEQRVRGLNLQRQEHELMNPQANPFAEEEQELHGLQLRSKLQRARGQQP